MGKRKTSPQDNWPVPVEITLYWVDERVRVQARRKITRYTHGEMPVSCPRGTLREPGTATIETRDHEKALAWLQERLREGWLTEAMLKEKQELMTILIRAAIRNAGGGKYDPASIANKKSGKGEKGSRKPTRDYRMPASVRNNGTVVGHRIKGVYGS